MFIPKFPRERGPGAQLVRPQINLRDKVILRTLYIFLLLNLLFAERLWFCYDTARLLILLFDHKNVSDVTKFDALPVNSSLRVLWKSVRVASQLGIRLDIFKMPSSTLISIPESLDCVYPYMFTIWHFAYVIKSRALDLKFSIQ